MMNEDMKMVFNSPNIVCPKCGSKFFKEVYVLKKISAIISPTGKEETMPIPFYGCAECGTIPDEITKSRNYKLVIGEEVAEEEQKPKSSIIMP